MARYISSVRMGQYKQKKYNQRRGRKPPPLKHEKKIPDVKRSELKRLDQQQQEPTPPPPRKRSIPGMTTNRAKTKELPLALERKKKNRPHFVDYILLSFDLAKEVFENGGQGVRRRLKTFKQDFK